MAITAKKLAREKGMLSVEEVEMIHNLVRQLPPDPFVVNIGAGIGTSALAILEAREDVILRTVDKRRKRIDIEQRLLKGSGVKIKDYFAYHGDSIKVSKLLLRNGHRADLVLFDGEHSYEYVRNEIEAWTPVLKPGAFVLVHDYGTENPVWLQVKRAVDEWRERHQYDLHQRKRVMVAIQVPHWGRDLKRHTLPYYVDLLDRGEPFGFARYGDGEWLTILGEYGRKNSNGCTFTKELSDALRNVLRNNFPYEHSILRIARRKLSERIGDFLQTHGYEVKWTIGDTFLDVMLKGKLYPLINQLRRRRIVYVGPDHLKDLDKTFFRIAQYVQVPKRNAILERDRIVPEIQQAVQNTGATIVGFSSGLHSKVFIDDIWRHFDGSITLIDFGSMWDGFFSVPSRSWIRKGEHNFKRLLKMNTKGRAP
jgi:predicted O-methyltransferase YrrM